MSKEPLKVEQWKTEDLAKHLHPKNPRIHPAGAIDKLVKSIKEFGWTNPVLMDKDNRVLAGHARIAAAQKAGVETIPVIKLPLSGPKADAYVIADNRLHQDTMWDPPLLADMLTELAANLGDLTVTGFDKLELDKILNPIPDENEALDEEEIAEKIEHKCPKCGFEW